MSSDKVIKVYFCPACRSKEVRYIFGFRNFFGIIPQMRCKKCGFTGMTFPILAVHEKHLKEANEKIVKRRIGHIGGKSKKKRIVIRPSQERR
jgi:hypothetical protein